MKDLRCHTLAHFERCLAAWRRAMAAHEEIAIGDHESYWRCRVLDPIHGYGTYDGDCLWSGLEQAEEV